VDLQVRSYVPSFPALARQLSQCAIPTARHIRQYAIEFELVPTPFSQGRKVPTITRIQQASLFMQRWLSSGSSSYLQKTHSIGVIADQHEIVASVRVIGTGRSGMQHIQEL